mgnify:CR=1 FL=1
MAFTLRYQGLINVDSNGIVFKRLIKTLRLSFLQFLKLEQRNSIIHPPQTEISLKKSGIENFNTYGKLFMQYSLCWLMEPGNRLTHGSYGNVSRIITKKVAIGEFIF